MKSSVFGRLALVAAAVCGLLFAGLYALALGTAYGRRLDGANDINAPAHEPFRTVVTWLADLGSIGGGIALVAAAAAALLALAWFRLGARAVVSIIVLLAGAVGSARVLKTVLGNLDLVGGEGLRSFGPGYLPSGHASALMALALAAVLLTPAGGRRTTVVVIGGAAMAIAGVGHVLARAHYPSDMIGGFLLAAAGRCSSPPGATAVSERSTCAAPSRRSRRRRRWPSWRRWSQRRSRSSVRRLRAMSPSRWRRSRSAAASPLSQRHLPPTPK